MAWKKPDAKKTKFGGETGLACGARPELQVREMPEKIAKLVRERGIGI